ncbi:helix-turn-helix domain-containing protein [Flavobacterium pectinovorum]|uniref:helix-turn-helix domain-containing protein n=1 Tax=Flavobacterium pectinovorum TaxID=29533 RepID=UPI00265F05D9|nr:helix-turn-helix domain-containing protein [Flavobacterium pectinovorum]WKL49743.1 helix-turn-helix domain-containing protein [Flavobacterium pectinovorum]
MQLEHLCPKTKGKLIFTHLQDKPSYFNKNGLDKDLLLTIALNGEGSQEIIINGMAHEFPSYSIIPLVSAQDYSFEKPERITAWQYSRDFYCNMDSYFEISCFGLLFFGYRGSQFLKLSESDREKFTALQQLFIEEFQTVDTIQTDMLQMLLKRLIILTTRLAKEQYLEGKIYEKEKFDLIRQFNILVDQHFKTEHQVSHYAGKLHKTPKNLTRIFNGFNYSSPSQIIQDRIIMEAKRLFTYTSHSVKEIAYELGFRDAGHFSRFFKKATGLKPSDFRKQQ